MSIDVNQCIYKTVTNQIDFTKWQELANLISEAFGSACGAVVQYRQEEFNVVVASDNDNNFLAKNDTWSWHQPSFCKYMLEQKDKLYSPTPKSDDVFKHYPAVAKGIVRSYAGVPIFWPDGTPFGTVCAIDTDQTQYSDTLQKLLVQLGRLIEADIKIMCDMYEMTQLAITDPATHTLNRRGFTELGEKLIKDAQRSGEHLGLLYLDINKLKFINDNNGHDAGDRCINGLANILLKQCRANELVARVGGDEFVVLAKFKHNQDLHKLATRIQQEYRSYADSQYDLTPSGVSIGLCFSNTDDKPNLENLLKAADNNMYQQKLARH